MNQYRNRLKGFTLIELMLAMAFVSALLLAIALTVIQIGNIYNRGITFKDVNQEGGTIASELQRSINMSTPFDLTKMYVSDNNWGGRLCTGKYSYIWNYGQAIASNAPSTLKNKYSGFPDEVIRFVKVIDSNSDYCKNPPIDIIKADAVELLNTGQNNLAIHSFLIDSNVLAYDIKTGQRLYYISFLLGTNEKSELDGSFDNVKCKLANEVESNVSFCAVNQFNIVARAGNNAVK